MIAFPNIKVDHPFGVWDSEGGRSFQNAADKTCRLLYLVGQLGLGGLERQLCYLLQAIERARYRPAVVVWNFSPDDDIYAHEIRALGVPIYCFPSGVSRVEKLRGLRRLVRQLDPEVIHSYSFYTNFAAWWSTLGCKTIPVGSIRNNFDFDRRESGRVLGRLSARWPTDQICNSVAAKRVVEKSLGPFKPSRLRVVTNKLDLDSFRFIPSLPSQPTILAVGRLYPEKRWDRLISAIALVRNRGMTFSVRHAGDGPLRQELEAQARRLSVDRLITFLGPRRDIPALLADSKFLVHTAEDEGCPNVVMEAMACGRAVIAMDAGEIRFLVEDGKTGFVVRCGDETAFADRVLRLLSDDELCRQMGLAARAKAEREFRLERLVSETLNAYRAAGWKG